MNINQKTSDDTTNLALDVINKNKQALVFVNTKRSAESTAEKIAKVQKNVINEDLSKEILSAVSSPTKQCKRLADIIKHGVAFHHSGLNYKQRQIVEDNFRNGKIKIICATPTLAQGLDLPAFRVIIRDLKRFGQRGMQNILVLEFEQMAGRAGRPGKETQGEAITIARTSREKDSIRDEFIYGIPENIYSKLGVEPVLRTYVLSLITAGFASSLKELEEFFSHTFYASQYQDLKKLNTILEKVVSMLKEWNFLEKSKEFVSGNEINNELLKPTILGRKVAELYLDPLTAHNIIEQLKNIKNVGAKNFSLLFMVCSTLEMRPLPNVRMSEFEEIIESTASFTEELYVEEPDEYDEDYEDFVKVLKLSLILYEWIEEKGEDEILSNYNVRPGELKAKLDIADWLLYSSVELSRIINMLPNIKHLNKLRKRLQYGVREELLTLTKLRNIGKVRARTLYKNNIKTLSDVKNAELTTLSQIIGKTMAQNIKKQLNSKETSNQEKLME